MAQEIRRKNLSTQVLAFGDFADRYHVQVMMEAGAVGYMLKSETPEAIVTAIRTAAKGKRYFSMPVVEELIAWEPKDRPGNLTRRELEVLQLLTKGLTNKEIASRLQLTERTVEFHVSNILRKLHVSSRLEAALWAKDHSRSS